MSTRFAERLRIHRTDSLPLVGRVSLASAILGATGVLQNDPQPGRRWPGVRRRSEQCSQNAAPNPLPQGEGRTAFFGIRAIALGFALLLSACATQAPKPTAAPAPSETPATGTAPSAPTAAASTPIPDDVRHAYDAALTSLQAGDWEGAARALKPIVDAHPELPGPAVNLGIAYAHLNRNDEARKIVDSAAQHSPGFAPAQHELGRLLAAAGEFQAADAAYAHALADDTNYALAHYDRAVLNELYLQKLPEALQDYEAYQRLQPQPDEQVARWIVDLQRRTGATAPPKAPASGTATPASVPAPVQPASAPKKGGSGS